MKWLYVLIRYRREAIRGVRYGMGWYPPMVLFHHRLMRSWIIPMREDLNRNVLFWDNHETHVEVAKQWWSTSPARLRAAQVSASNSMPTQQPHYANAIMKLSLRRK